MVQTFCDLGLIMAEQDWTEAGVSSSDRTQLTSRLKTPTNVKNLQSVECPGRGGGRVIKYEKNGSDYRKI